MTAARRPRWKVYLELGRISNLPTVWTNVLAGVFLGGGLLEPLLFGALLMSLSSFYVAGMFLNDAFDADWDRRWRPRHPIPAGEVSRREVFAAGFTVLLAGEGMLVLPGLLRREGLPGELLLLGLVLGLLIVYYSAIHKKDPLSPLVMALCRGMVYLIAASAVASPWTAAVLGGAAVLALYLVGLTAVARHEHLSGLKAPWLLALLAAPFLYTASLPVRMDAYSLIWVLFLAWVAYSVRLVARREERNIPRGVVSLIAGISLLDAVLMGSAGAGVLWAAPALGGFVLTLALQRVAPGS